MKRVYIIPNLLTAANMMFGMLAIFEILGGDYRTACYLIVISAVLDFLDGRVARMMKSSSNFGVNFDSLADVAAFAVAPAILMFSCLTSQFGLNERAAGGVCVPFAICGALRLARFNVEALGSKGESFTGLPTPAAAGAMIGLYFLMDRFSNLVTSVKALPAAAACLVVLVAYLMVSKIRYPSLKRIALPRRKSFDMLVAMVLFGGLIILLKHQFEMVVAIGAYTYLLLGIGLHARRLLTHEARQLSVDSGQ